MPPERRTSMAADVGGPAAVQTGLPLKSEPGPLSAVARTVPLLDEFDVAKKRVDTLFSIIDKMRFHKKQTRRMAESGRDLVEEVEFVIETAASASDGGKRHSDNVRKLSYLLRQANDRILKIAQLGFVDRILQDTSIRHDITSLDNSIRSLYTDFGIPYPADSARRAFQTEKDQADDVATLRAEAGRLSGDPDGVMELLGSLDSKEGQHVTRSLQMLLHSIDNRGDKINPEIKSFAETFSRSIKLRTNFEVPRNLPWFIKWAEIEKGEKIGSGGFSSVHKGFWKAQQKTVAVKIFNDRERLDELFDEILIWKSLQHPCLHGFIAGDVLEQPAFVISAYHANGNAYEYITTNPKADRATMLLDIARGMEYLHLNNIVHGDLKARNVLISDEGRSLIADFGLAKFSHAKLTISDTTPANVILTGTIRWLAPECFRDGRLTKATDIWAFGITAFELYTNGGIPFAQLKEEELGQNLQEGLKPVRPTAVPIPDHIWLLMRQSWDLDPITRPAVGAIALVLGAFHAMDTERMLDTRRAIELRNLGWFPHQETWPALFPHIVELLKAAPEKPSEPVSEDIPTLEINSPTYPRWNFAVDILAMLNREVEPNGPTEAERDVFLDLLIEHRVVFQLVAVLSREARRDPTQNGLPDLCRIIGGLLRDNSSLNTHPVDPSALSDVECKAIEALSEVIQPSEGEFTNATCSALRDIIHYRAAYGASGVNPKELPQKKHASQAGAPTKLAVALEQCKDEYALNITCGCIGTLGLVPSVLTAEQLERYIPTLVSLTTKAETLMLRQTAVNTLAVFLYDEVQIKKIRQGQLFEQMTPLWRSPGQELYAEWKSGPVFVGGIIMEKCAAQKHIPELLELISQRESYEQADKLHMDIETYALSGLRNIGERASVEERKQMAKEHGIFPKLQKRAELIQDVKVGDWVPLDHPDFRKSLFDNLAMYASPDDLSHLATQMLDSSRSVRLSAVQSLNRLLDNASWDQKRDSFAIPEILSSLKSLIEAPADVPAPTTVHENPSPISSALASPKPFVPTDVLESASTLISNEDSDRSRNSDKEAGVASAVPTKTTKPLEVAPAVENGHVDGETPSKALPSVSSALSTDENVSSSRPETPTPVLGPPDSNETKSIATKQSNAASVNSGESHQPEDVLHKEAYLALYNLVTSEVADADSFDAITAAFINADLHKAFVNFLSEKPPSPFAGCQYYCLWNVGSMTASEASGRDAMMDTISELFPKLQKIIESWSTNSEVIPARWACCAIRDLLCDDPDEDDDIDFNISWIEFAAAVAHYLSGNSGDERMQSGRAMAFVIQHLPPETSDDIQVSVCSAMEEACAADKELLESAYAKQLYLLVRYLQHSLPKVRLLGLALVKQLLKTSVNARKAITSTSGFRAAIQACASGDNEEVSTAAKETMDKLKLKQR